jgi:5-(carboxyamino)imidazole ribonucleotide synthase
MIVPPGSTIGIVGGGQLGRMLGIAAAQLGYRCHIFDPHEHPPAADVAACFTRAEFTDTAALEKFGNSVDVATYEFENLPVGPLELLGDKLRPGTRSLAIAQDRAREKEFIETCGARVAPWRSVSSLDEVRAAVAELGTPLVLKARRYGYDGKGQAWIHAADDAAAAWAAIAQEPAVAEAAVDFTAEFSVLLARTSDGRMSAYNVPANTHRDGILRRSEVPAPAEVQGMTEQAIVIASNLAGALDHVGMFTVEFFASAEGALVNEVAPRVHNSGHWTIEGAVTSQFEQHIRAICGLPLGSPVLTGRTVAMDNVIGDEVNGWAELIADPSAHVHIYGKGKARPGRKMGHVTRVNSPN